MFWHLARAAAIYRHRLWCASATRAPYNNWSWHMAQIRAVYGY